MKRPYRVAVIASTERGGYGHGLDTAFADADLFKLVALADDDAAGRAAAGKRLGLTALYADFREMLAREKPDIVAICPRWVTDHVSYVTAAAEAGAHIFLEKPLAATLLEADAMLAACTKAKVKCALAHQLRAMPPVQQAFAEIRAGRHGRILRLHGRPTDDARGGGEELIVHGSHFFDLMIALAGPPAWVSAHFAVGERDATPDDKREGREPIGPILGDSVEVMIGFAQGVRGYWHSTANLASRGNVYGLLIECERSSILIRTQGEVFIYPRPTVEPEDESVTWQKLWVEGWHFDAEHRPVSLRDFIHRGNRVLVRDLVAAIEQDHEPTASLRDAVYVTEIIQGAYASHLDGGRRVAIPLQERKHPLAVG